MRTFPLASRRSISLLALWSLVACGRGGGTTTPLEGTATVGTSGGTVKLAGGPSVTVPAGALTSDRTLTVVATGGSGPSGNPVFSFGPAGTSFTSPVTVTLPRPPGLAVGAQAAVYWTRPGSTTQYDALPSAVGTDGVTAEVSHFSLGFVGAPCTAGQACGGELGLCNTSVIDCSSGAPVCVQGPPRICFDGDPCTADTCDPQVGCRHVAATDGTMCGSGDPCTTLSTCQAGACIAGGPLSCDDGNPCTADTCDPQVGCRHVAVANGVECGAGDACTTAWTCQAGRCDVGAPVSCDDGDLCTADTCNPSTGCAHSPMVDGAVCGAITACDFTGVCQAGTCTGLMTRDCGDGNPCTADTCDPVRGCAHAALANGTACGDGFVCSASACLTTASVRDVTVHFQMTHWPDDGAKTTLPVDTLGDRVPQAVIVPDGSTGGYTSYPFIAGVAPAVPLGRYFLHLAETEIGTGGVVNNDYNAYYEFTTSFPTFEQVSSARPDLAFATAATPVTLNVTGMSPWVSSFGQLMISGSQSDTDVWATRLTGRPPANATTHSVTFDWTSPDKNLGSLGLPDPAKGDVLYVVQRRSQTVGAPAFPATHVVSVASARLSSYPPFASGQAVTLDATLVATPTFDMAVDVRTTQFEAIAAEMGPNVSADPSVPFSVAVFNTPHTLSGPDMPGRVGRSGFLQIAPGSPDFDFGLLPFGLPFDGLWKQWRQVHQGFLASVLAPGASAATTIPLGITTMEPLDPTPPNPIMPQLGPVTAPRVSGADATADVAASVGREPVISWSPPALGTPTGYVLEVFLLGETESSTGAWRVLAATLRTGTGFRIPPRNLQYGWTYVAVITAVDQPWDGQDGNPLANGLPSHRASRITGRFTP